MIAVFRMATRRYFQTKDKAWLIAKLDELAEREASGMAAIGGSLGEVNVSNFRESSPSDIRRKIEWDLWVLDPANYGPPEPSRTVATFGTSP